MTSIFFFLIPKGRASSLGILITIERIIFTLQVYFVQPVLVVYLIWLQTQEEAVKSLCHMTVSNTATRGHCQLRIRTKFLVTVTAGWVWASLTTQKKKNFNLSSAFLHITDIQKGSIGRNQTYKSLPAFTGETSKSSFSYNMEEERCG